MPKLMTTATRRRDKITPDVVRAWKRCDVLAMFECTDIASFERLPFPTTITALGVDPDNEPTRDGSVLNSGWAAAVELQRALLEQVGPPDEDAVKASYERNLQEDESYLAHLKSGRSFSDDRRPQQIREWESRVAWRCELLESLPCES